MLLESILNMYGDIADNCKGSYLYKSLNIKDSRTLSLHQAAKVLIMEELFQKRIHLKVQNISKMLSISSNTMVINTISNLASKYFSPLNKTIVLRLELRGRTNLLTQKQPTTMSRFIHYKKVELVANHLKERMYATLQELEVLKKVTLSTCNYGTLKAAEKELKRMKNNIKFYINLSTQLREKYNFLHTSVFNSNGELCQIEDKLKGALHYFYFSH